MLRLSLTALLFMAACAGARAPSASTATTPQAKLELCDSAQIHWCLALAEDHELGRGVARDPERAAELYAKACRAGLPAGCVNLGILEHRTDRAAATDHFRRACELNGPRMRVESAPQPRPQYLTGIAGRVQKNSIVTHAHEIGCVNFAVIRADEHDLATYCAEGLELACDKQQERPRALVRIAIAGETR